jgi:tetratricopeptide (TPR) repeat protein
MASISLLAAAMVCASVSLPGELLARGGRGGGGGGGAARGGGGGARGGGNFGGGAMSHTPSFSRPSGGMGGGGMGAGGEKNPFGGGGGAAADNRPNVGGGGAAGNHPNFGGGNAAGDGGAAGVRPGGGGTGTPGNRPNFGSGNAAGGGGAAGIGPGGGGAGAAGNRPNGGNGNFGNRNFNNDNFTNRNFNNNNLTNRNFNNNFNNNNINRNFNNFGGNNINVNRAGQYGSWYHGNWNGNAGWNAGGYRPWGWGWGGSGFGWGLGAGLATAGLVAAVSPWNWGYYGYSNPYWNGGGSTYINYSQPIVAAAPLDPGGPLLADDGSAPLPGPLPGDVAGAPGPATDQDQAMAIFEGARGQFTAGDYAGALAATDNAIKLQPNDPVLHEFRALCLFAEGDYQQAAAATYAVLSGGPGWDWTTVSSLYPSTMVYTQQLRALENYSQQHPDAADARFLLAYQYLLTGHNDAASAQLKQVVALQPNDTLSAQLLKSISPATDAFPTDAPGANGAPALAGAAPATKPVTAGALVGNWTASRPDGTKVEMDLTGANQFTWRFDQGGKPQQLAGTYTLADNYLVLKASQQNALVGQVGLLANDEMSFRLADNNPADPGLVFKR